MLQSCAGGLVKTWNAGSEVFKRCYLLSRHAPGTFQNGSRECRLHHFAFLVRIIRDGLKPVSFENDVFIQVEHAAKQYSVRC